MTAIAARAVAAGQLLRLPNGELRTVRNVESAGEGLVRIIYLSPVEHAWDRRWTRTSRSPQIELGTRPIPEDEPIEVA